MALSACRDIDPAGRYLHYTAADTRQGFEFHEFPYEVTNVDCPQHDGPNHPWLWLIGLSSHMMALITSGSRTRY